jgi:hypothetical protein
VIELGPCELTGVYGPMASGKTYLIDQWLKSQSRFVRFDVTGETCDDPNIEHVWSSPLKLWERLRTNPFYFRIAYHPGPELEQDFEFALRAIWRLKTFRMFVCDEFHEVCSVSGTPGYVRTMMRYARHNHLAFIGASQRIADVSKLFTAGCRTTVLYWTQESCDLDAIAGRWGSDCADAVANLRPLVFDDVNKVTLQIPQAVVCKKSQRPVIYDFQTNETRAIGLDNGETEQPGSPETDREVQSEDSCGGTGPTGSGPTPEIDQPELEGSDGGEAGGQ